VVVVGGIQLVCQHQADTDRFGQESGCLDVSVPVLAGRGRGRQLTFGSSGGGGNIT
jgi:hypothetical protein